MNNGDVAKILSVGGLAQGVSFIVGMNRVYMFYYVFGKAENQPTVYAVYVQRDCLLPGLCTYLNLQPYTSQEG